MDSKGPHDCKVQSIFLCIYNKSDQTGMAPQGRINPTLPISAYPTRHFLEAIWLAKLIRATCLLHINNLGRTRPFRSH